MKYFISLLIIWSISLSAFAQLQDNFLDGNFTQNPTWSGDASEFIIDNAQLRSAGPSATAILSLSTPNAQINDKEWRFLIDLRFAPSGSNQLRVYLVSNQSNLKGNLNGYYLEIGQTGNDFIRIFRQNGANSTLLFTGSTAFSSTVKVRIKIVRDALGNWEIFADPTEGELFNSEGNPFLDNTYNSTQFFGIVCNHTSSNRNNFFLDDFYIGDEIIDNESPTLLNILVESTQRLTLQFSEAMTNLSAQSVANYTVNNGLGIPLTAQINTSNPSQVFLEFTNSFISGISNTLTISGLQDLSGNPLSPNPTQAIFVYNAPPQYHEFIITEIMADPTGDAAPLNGLPEAEFIEIYNRSNRSLNLKDVVLKDNGGSFTLPDYVLASGAYVVLCGQSSLSGFQLYGSAIAIPTFPSLTNSGELLKLESATGNLIFAVEYSDSWYQNSSKAEGGWTLEMIDTENPCVARKNWIASESNNGGTPSRVNSVADTRPDLTAPELWRSEALNTQTLRLTFNESMNQTSLQNGTYSLSNGLNVVSVVPVAPFFRQVLLQVSPEISPNQSYQVSVEGLTDCNGNLIRNANQGVFGLAIESDFMDVILNEILFNPRTAGNDFIEIYNHSSKFINLKDWKLANLSNEIIANQRMITTEDYILAPKSYLLLSANTDNIQDNYPLAVTRTFLQMSSLPSFNDDDGTVFLINNQDLLIERFDYNEDFHFPLLDDKEGVSLERISFEVPTNQRDSWKSASANVGFATPGYLNSQQANANQPSAKITINPTVFTPDGDGQSDFTQIQYLFDRGSYVVDIFIYDRNGREIKRIAERNLLGTEAGFFTWDGTDNSGVIARMGYYMVLVKALDLNGKTQVYKEKVVVGKRF
jgi:hypothetical protein